MGVMMERAMGSRAGGDKKNKKQGRWRGSMNEERGS